MRCRTSCTSRRGSGARKRRSALNRHSTLSRHSADDHAVLSQNHNDGAHTSFGRNGVEEPNMTVATATESNVQQAVPFFMVNDIAASLPFYVDCLGLRK